MTIEVLLVSIRRTSSPFFFFFNDTATTEIYTLSLHDALPIFCTVRQERVGQWEVTSQDRSVERTVSGPRCGLARSEEHTSELQSPDHLVCRLLLEKKNITGASRVTCVSMHSTIVDVFTSATWP